MAVRDVLLLGDPLLYEWCEPVKQEEVAAMQTVVQDLHDTLFDFRTRHNAGRAIAAPQIGVLKRLVYLHIDRPVVLVNPALYARSPEMMELWDDCMSFPGLLVRVRRHRRCKLVFRDLEWNKLTWELEDDLSELLQHECDHLDGVLAVSRAIDARSFSIRRGLAPIDRAPSS